MSAIDSADLRELLEFVRDYSFLYERLNVEFFSAGVYHQIDPEWLYFMCKLNWTQLNSLPLNFEQYPDCPQSLNHFFSTVLRLSLLDKYCEAKIWPKNNEEKGRMMRKVKQKKAHELEIFTEFLLDECSSMRIDRVVDVGCGLGHLGRMLLKRTTQMHYTGIEADPELCHSAHKIADGKIGMQNMFFSPETTQEYRQILSPPGHKSAIVSLHGCGDLQRSLLTEFVSLAKDHQKGHGAAESTSLLITVGCCYHKLKNWANSDIERWVLSRQVRNQFRRTFEDGNTFPIPGLRLACQAKLTRWMTFSDKEHLIHQQAFANRALVECMRLIKSEDGGGTETGSNGREETRIQSQMGRTVRKLNRKLDFTNMEQFRFEILRRIELNEEDEGSNEVDRKLDEVIGQHEHAIHFIEPFTALQFALQAPLESLVLLDRLAYLRECGLDAKLVELFDPLISPRNIAIVARLPATPEDQ